MLGTTQRITEIWPKRFDLFRDLIYVPLDLPDPPAIDLELFVDWAKHAPSLIGKIRCPETNEAIVHFEKKGAEAWGEFPWIQVSAFHHGYSDKWIADFDKTFPEVVEYVNLFPYNIFSGLTIIIQKQFRSVPLHTDPDDWLGMRFYLKNEVKKDILYFAPAVARQNTRIPPYNYDYDTKKWVKNDLKNLVHEEHKMYAKHPKSLHPWCLSSIRAAHGLDRIENRNYDRITALVHAHKGTSFETAWNQDKLYDLLQRSLAKYHDYAIWWEEI